jgi:hypothetical protein
MYQEMCPEKVESQWALDGLYAVLVTYLGFCSPCLATASSMGEKLYDSLDRS